MIQDTIAPAVPDTILLPPGRAMGDSLYIAMLERVNGQLAMLPNWYGVMIAALGVLFTIGGIAAAIVIWRQGADYRRMLDEEVQRYRDLLDAVIAERLEAMELRLEEHIESAEEQLQNATGEQEELWRERLEALEEKRKKIRTLPRRSSAANLGLGHAGNALSLALQDLVDKDPRAVSLWDSLLEDSGAKSGEKARPGDDENQED